MTRLTRSEGFASSGAGADFSFASNDFKTLGAFFVRGAKALAKGDLGLNLFLGGFTNRHFSESMEECRRRRISTRFRPPS